MHDLEYRDIDICLRCIRLLTDDPEGAGGAILSAVIEGCRYKVRSMTEVVPVQEEKPLNPTA